METRRLAEVVGVARACEALAIPRSSYYYAMRQERRAAECADKEILCQPSPPPKEPVVSPRRLSPQEVEHILAIVVSERFSDLSVAAIYYTLLDEGIYLASQSTIGRLLRRRGLSGDRRLQRRHESHSRPELVASAPNQVWTWDITKLKGPARGIFYSLYVIIDLFSRSVVGWLLGERESEELASKLIRQSCRRQNIQEDRLVIHADRGSVMRSLMVSELLEALKVGRSHSRPYCSNDNPYIESHFKTMKYRPTFPDRFASIEKARTFCEAFFLWYNIEHRHSGIAWLTPNTVQYDRGDDVLRRRDRVLAEAHAKHPERFVRGVPTAPRLMAEVWINEPDPRQSHEEERSLN